MNMINFIIFSIFVFARASSLRAFDCNHPGVTFMSIDLSEPEKCPDPKKIYKPPVQKNVLVVQSDQSLIVEAGRCKVTLTKEVTVCGFDNLNYGTRYPVWEKDLSLTAKDCRQARQDSEITIEGRKFQFEEGVVLKARYYSHGFINEDLTFCSNTAFESEGVHYEHAVEFVRLDILVETVRGTADLSQNSIHFTNGLRAVYDKGYVLDDIKGTFVWDIQENQCREFQSQVFFGEAALHKRIKENDMGEETLDSLVVVESKSTQQFIGLVLRGKLQICNRDCFITDVKGLNVCFYEEGQIPMGFRFKNSFDISRADRLTQLGFLHLTNNLDVAKRFEKLSNDVCQLDRRVLSTKLQTIAGGNPFALLDIFKEGHDIFVAGRAAYVSKCVPVEVTMGHSLNCTTEIPVIYNGTQMFLDPLTLVLKDFAEIQVCDSKMPVMWFLDPHWYCSTPHPSQCAPPARLNVTFGLHRPERDFTIGLGNGAFSEAMQNEHRLFLRMHHSRDAVVSKVTQDMTTNAQNGVLGIPISKDNMFGLSWDLLYNISPVAYVLGTGWMIFVALVSLVGMLKFTFGTIIRMIILLSSRRDVNIFVAIIATVWHSAFEIVMMPVERTVHLYKWFNGLGGQAEGVDNEDPQIDVEAGNQPEAVKHVGVIPSIPEYHLEQFTNH